MSTQSPAVGQVILDEASDAKQVASLIDRQKVYLLKQLLEAPDNRLALGEANKKIGSIAKKELQLSTLTANSIREGLVESGFLKKGLANRKISFTLTDAGRVHLQTLPHDLFPSLEEQSSRPPRREGDVPPTLLPFQQSYLLLVLFQANQRKLPASEFEKKLQTKSANTVGFEGVIARHVITPLLESGYIEEHQHRKSINADGLYPVFGSAYRLTEFGQRELFTREQYHGISVRMTGEQFNDLIAALRKTSSPKFVGATERSEDLEKDQVVGSPHNLRDAILARFNELLHENYTNAGMVPIHELRAWVLQHFGPEAASHKNFDEIVNDLRKKNQVRFVTISDLRRGTPEQMEASIPGVNETFFYLEPAHEQSFDF